MMRSTDAHVISLCISLLLICGGCRTSRPARTDAAKRINYNQYGTFDFGEAYVLSSSNPAFSRAQFSERVRHEIAFDLPAKGLDRDQTNPDLNIYWYAVVQGASKPPLITYRIGWAAEPFIDHGERFDVYSSNTLVIDFVDVHSNELVWRGSTSLPFNQQDSLYKVMPQRIHHLLQRYPMLP